MKQRFFQLDTEWNVIHYPEKPNGFGVLVLGDEGHFVEDNNSFWLQHIGRSIWLKDLKEAGYTVFCSNLYGNHWGSERAKALAESLYHFVCRNEILNSRIHIIAEGMGALIIPSLVQDLRGNIRSINLINPYFSIQEKIEEEQNHLFYYKRILRDIEKGNPEYKDQIHLEKPMRKWVFPEALSVFYIFEGNRASTSKRIIDELVYLRKQCSLPTTIRYILPERRTNISKLLIGIFQGNEEI